MNTTIEIIEEKVDFCKVQILECIQDPDLLVMNTGRVGGDTQKVYYFEGIVLTEVHGRNVGDISDSWDMDKFRIFRGKLILQNEK